MITKVTISLTFRQKCIQTIRSNPYIIDLGATDPQVRTPGGIARLGSNPYFPILLGISVFVLDLEPSGIIEPHTHPNAAELNYVIEGKIRFTILGPKGEIETNEMVKGQVFFVSAGYFHYLENSDNSKTGSIASFFSNESPQFLGLVRGLCSYSNTTLGTMFNKDSEFFNDLPCIERDVQIAATVDYIVQFRIIEAKHPIVIIKAKGGVVPMYKSYN